MSPFLAFFSQKSQFARKKLNINWQVGTCKKVTLNGLVTIMQHTGILASGPEHCLVLVCIIVPPQNRILLTTHNIIVVQYNKYTYVVVLLRLEYLHSWLNLVNWLLVYRFVCTCTYSRALNTDTLIGHHYAMHYICIVKTIVLASCAVVLWALLNSILIITTQATVVLRGIYLSI